MRATLRTPILALAVAAVAGCAANPRPGDPGDDPVTTVRVENQSSLDMTIYVLRGSQRNRLGTATAHLTTSFTIPRNLIFGITSLRFLADPIGSSRNPITHEIAVTPGDEVLLTIPPR